MNHLLLILLLVAPGDKGLGDRMNTEITSLVGSSGKVLIGPDASRALENHGLKDSDLLSSPSVGEQVTRQSPDLILVRLEGRKAGGDDLIESSIWVRGHLERHVSIAGKGRDAMDGAIHGVLAVLAPELAALNDPSPSDESRLPQLVTSENWREIAALVDPIGPPPLRQTARELYYGVLANVHLQHLDHAREILERMHRQWPDHVLTAAADAVMPGATPAEVPAPGPRPTSAVGSPGP